MNNFAKTLTAAAFTLSASFAHAGVVTFDGWPATTFADGTFSGNLSGIWEDGFYGSGTSAYNGFGQTGEYISFNTAKQLNHLTLSYYHGLEGVKVNVYDAGNTLLAQQTANFLQNYSSTLTFDLNNVSKIVFDNIGGSDAYGDGRTAGWYYISNVTYSDNVASSNNVPEPGSLAMLGLGLAGLIASRRRK